MLTIGLTGSIAMGKTTVARMFAREGVPVFDSDACVHDLYKGVAVAPVEAIFPNVSVNGQIDRNILGSRVIGDSSALRMLEKIVHPLVAAARTEFIGKARSALRKIVVLDVPLLFESGAAESVDIVAVVTAPPDVQRSRAMTRSGMTSERFSEILRRQISDVEKRRRAHHVIDTSSSMERTYHQVQDVIRCLSALSQR